MQWLAKLFYLLCAPCRPNKSATVRYAFPMLLAFAAVLGAATIGTSSESYVKLESSTANIVEGKTFWVDVYAYAHTPVNAVDISLAFSESKVEILGIDTGRSVLTIWTEEPYVEDGAVVLRGGTFRRGFVGEHLIATVNMRGKATGVAQFGTDGIQFLAGDGSGSEVGTVAKDDAVTIYIYDEDEAPADIGAEARIEIITDLDGDGSVTLKDVSMFMSGWFGEPDSKLDFNKDGKVTFIDFSIILAHSFFK